MLTPLAVDPAHPFPYISGLSLNLAVSVRDPDTGSAALRPGQGAQQRARGSSRSGPTDRTATFLPLEDLIAAHLPQLFPGLDVARPPPVPGHPQRRPGGRGGPRRGPAAGAGARAGPPPVRPGGAAGGHRARWTRRSSRCCCSELEMQPGGRRCTCPGLLDLAALMALYDLDRPELKDEPFVPATHPRLSRGRDAQERVRHPPRGRRPGAPPLRLVRHQRAAVHRAGRRRPERAGDQADAVPHLR